MSDDQRVRGRVGPTDEEIRKATPRDKAARDLRVGIFVLLGFIAVVAALFLLTDPASLRGRYLLITAVTDAGGVRRGDPVLMKGVNIGRVSGFEMTPDEMVTITMEIEGQWDIPRDSRTLLAGAGLLGGQTLEIQRGTSAEMAEPMDTLRGAGEAIGIMESAQSVTARADQVLIQLNKALDDGTVSSVRGSAADLQILMTDLRGLAAAQRSQLGQLTASLNRTAAGFEPSGAAARQVLARADSAAIALNRTSVTLDRAATSLEAVMGRLNTGEGTLGKLSRDDSLYVNLNRAALEIGNLAADIRANPRKYVNLEIF
jgi:phospholipid/cholesterol/gamma-HCH transport system substrate-binding protein